MSNVKQMSADNFLRMRDSPEFAIKFVQAVEKYPCLWNTSLKDYSNREITDLAWENISECVEDTVLNCRVRWKNIRCAFVRSERLLSKSAGKKRKKLYYLSNYLQFLQPYFRNKSTTNNSSTIVEDNSNDQLVRDNTEQVDKKTFLKETTDFKIEEPTLSKEVVSVKCEPPVYEDESNFVECLPERNSFSTDDNADLLFFRSLLPDINKLTDRNKRKFRTKVINLLDELLDEEEEL